MAMNQFGAGFIIDARDFASSVFRSVGRNFSGMSRRAGDDAQRMQGAIQRVAKGMAVFAAGFAIVRPIQNALAESTKLNTALAEVSTLTDEATFPLAKMNDIVKDLAAKYGENATDQAKALYQTISAGFGDAADAAAILDTANKLAIGGVTDVETAVDGLTNVLNTYSAANLSAMDVSDAFFVAVKAGKTTIGELAGQVGRIAPAAEALKIPMDEMLAAMAAITTKGISTSEAASGLAGAIANINKPTKDAKDEAKRLGIEFSAAGVRSKGFKGFLDSITKSSKFNEDSIAKLFGSVEAFKVMLALTSNDGEKFNEIMDQMGERVGATDKAVAKMEDTFAHQAKRFTAISNNIATTIGNAAEAIVAPILKAINFVTEGISAFLDGLPPGARKAIVGFVGAFGGLVSVIGLVMALGGVLGLLGVSVTGLISTFAGLILLAVPLTVLFAGLGVAVYSAYRSFQKNTGGIAVSFADMVKKVKLAWQGMMMILTDGEPTEKFVNNLKKAEEFGVLRFLKKFGAFVERLRFFWGGLVKGFEEGVDALAGSPAMKRLQSAIDGIIGIFTGDGAKDSVDTLKEWESKGESAGKRLAELGEIALSALSKIIELGGAFAKFASTLTAEDITTGLNDAIDTFRTLWEILKGTAWFLGEIWKALKSIGYLLQTIGALFGDTFIVPLITGEYSDFSGTADRFNKFLKSTGSDFRIGEDGSTRPVSPQARGIAWQRPMESIQDLEKAREDIIGYMRTSTAEFRKEHPGRYSFQEATPDIKSQYIAELARLERLIKAMANRPVQLNVDGEKFAETVGGSDVATGAREYDPGDEDLALGF